MTMKHRIVGACLALALCCGGAPGDDKPGSKDAAAVGKSLAALAAAYNARDAKAIGEVFTTTGEFVDGSGNVSEMFRQTIERIRSSYFIQYVAPPTSSEGFRRVRVTLSPGAQRRYPEAVIRVKAGYYATP